MLYFVLFVLPVNSDIGQLTDCDVLRVRRNNHGSWSSDLLKLPWTLPEIHGALNNNGVITNREGNFTFLNMWFWTKILFVDGTFECRPESPYRLFSIRGVKGNFDSRCRDGAYNLFHFGIFRAARWKQYYEYAYIAHCLCTCIMYTDWLATLLTALGYSRRS